MTGWAVAAAVSIGAAVWTGRPDDGWVLARRLGEEAHEEPGSRPTRTVALAVVAAMLVTLLSVVPSTPARLAVAACASAAWFGLRLRRQAVARDAARDFSVEVAQFVRSLAGELRAGVIPVVAVQAVAADASDRLRSLRRVSAADVPAALRHLAELPGGSGLLDAAAAWEVADRAGAPLAGILERVADGVQDDVDISREVAMEAAPARATGTLMAMLPAVGLLLGTTVGANPVHVLLGTVLGVTCLALGLALACAGLWWIDRIVRAVEQR